MTDPWWVWPGLALIALYLIVVTVRLGLTLQDVEEWLIQKIDEFTEDLNRWK